MEKLELLEHKMIFWANKELEVYEDYLQDIFLLTKDFLETNNGFVAMLPKVDILKNKIKEFLKYKEDTKC
jgi:hypothetical protein